MTGFWLMFGLDIYTKCLRHPLSLNKEPWERSHYIYCLTLTSAFPLQRPSRPKVINNDECDFSLCASETDGESLWTTIACRQGPWCGCLKTPQKMYIKKRYEVLWFFFLHICLLNDRFLQRAVTALPACMRIHAVTEQHPSLREMTDSFSAWFSLSASPFLSKLPFPKLSLPFSPSLSSLA